MTKTIPIVKRKTATGYFNLSTPEATFFDLVQFNRHLGGLSQVGLVLSDMLERISPQSLISAAQHYPDAIVQRGAYLLELLNQNQHCDILAAYINQNSPAYTYLNSSGDPARISQHRRWKLFINETVTIDQ